MRANRIRTIWDEGGVVLNCWVSSPSTLQTAMIGSLGFDAVLIDRQHGEIDAADVREMVTALSDTEAVPLVRVPWNEPAAIMQALDAGAYGVMAPMINTRSDAEAFVAWSRYPPAGERSFGPLRAQLHARATAQEYFAQANETIVTIAQIETAQAMANLDEILATPGLDAVYLGSADLSVSVGGPPVVDHVEPRSVAWDEAILDAGRRHGVRVGLHAGGLHAGGMEAVRLCAERGADLITVATDMGELRGGLAEKLAQSRRIVAP